MRKFAVLFLILLWLAFGFLRVTTFALNTNNILKEGVYSLSDLNISTDNLYNITNVSPKEDAYIIIFDENYVIMQSLRLSPSIKSFNLIALKPNYKIVVLGKTEIYIDPR